MKVLGIDPGVGRLGWAIVEKSSTAEKLIDCGCLETPANSPLPSRLKQIHLFLTDLIKEHQPQEASVEDIFFAKNAKTAMAVSAARGAVLLTCALAQIPAYSYTPLNVKSTITGYGQAEKKQVEYMVIKLLKLKQIPKLDDTVDAIATALTHLAHPRSSAVLQ